MTRRDVRTYLHDIKRACDLVAEFVRGKTEDEYLRCDLLKSAVERQLQIAGEALSQALATEPSLEQRITDARIIVAFRHRLVHGYDQLVDAAVWEIACVHSPKLGAEAMALLSEHDRTG